MTDVHELCALIWPQCDENIGRRKESQPKIKFLSKSENVLNKRKFEQIKRHEMKL